MSIAGEVHEEECRDIDQENGSGIMSQHFESLSRRKEMKILDELFRDKRQLYHDRK